MGKQIGIFEERGFQYEQYYETDKMQITHHSNYIRFMEEARLDFMEQLGWGYNEMETAGIISPVIGVTCDYKRSTSYPDCIHIVVKIAKLSLAKLELSYQMTVDDVIVCEATSAHCFLNAAGRPVSLKKEFPDFYASLEKLMEEQ